MASEEAELQVTTAFSRHTFALNFHTTTASEAASDISFELLLFGPTACVGRVAGWAFGGKVNHIVPRIAFSVFGDMRKAYHPVRRVRCVFQSEVNYPVRCV